jgi:hypothetical protein
VSPDFKPARKRARSTLPWRNAARLRPAALTKDELIAGMEEIVTRSAARLTGLTILPILSPPIDGDATDGCWSRRGLYSNPQFTLKVVNGSA